MKKKHIYTLTVPIFVLMIHILSSKVIIRRQRLDLMRFLVLAKCLLFLGIKSLNIGHNFRTSVKCIHTQKVLFIHVDVSDVFIKEVREVNVELR